MKNNPTPKPRRWRLLCAALCGTLLLAGAGCICISINTGGGLDRPTARQPAGGPFTAVPAQPLGGGVQLICGQTVSGTYFRFWPPYQIPTPGSTGFRGRLYNTVTGTDIPTANYVLQWIVTGANTGCGTPVPGTFDVTCPVTPGVVNRYAAHFKSTPAPPAGTVELRGAWTP